MSKILLIDDDSHVVEVVAAILEDDNHFVDVTTTAEEGLHKLSTDKYDIVILDLVLPTMSGQEICRSFRQGDSTTPVIMLTSSGSKQQIVQCLDGGADDYLIKPFDQRELCARVRSLVRRGERNLSDDKVVVGDLELDVSKRTLNKAGREVYLLPREFSLLEFFMRHPQSLFSQESLLKRVWRSAPATSPDTVRGHIKQLRRKIDDSAKLSYIRTVRGQGYLFEAPGDSGIFTNRSQSS